MNRNLPAALVVVVAGAFEGSVGGKISPRRGVGAR